MGRRQHGFDEVFGTRRDVCCESVSVRSLRIAVELGVFNRGCKNKEKRESAVKYRMNRGKVCHPLEARMDPHRQRTCRRWTRASASRWQWSRATCYDPLTSFHTHASHLPHKMVCSRYSMSTRGTSASAFSSTSSATRILDTMLYVATVIVISVAC